MVLICVSDAQTDNFVTFNTFELRQLAVLQNQLEQPWTELEHSPLTNHRCISVEPSYRRNNQCI